MSGTNNTVPATQHPGEEISAGCLLCCIESHPPESAISSVTKHVNDNQTHDYFNEYATHTWINGFSYLGRSGRTDLLPLAPVNTTPTFLYTMYTFAFPPRTQEQFTYHQSDGRRTTNLVFIIV